MQFVLALAPGVSQVADRTISCGPTWPMHVVEDATYDALGAADLSIVSSGTATVEAALMDAPMIVVYRLAPLTAAIARLLVRTPMFAMVNLIAGKRVVPELVQKDFTPDAAGERSDSPARFAGCARGDAPRACGSSRKARPPGRSRARGGHDRGDVES